MIKFGAVAARHGTLAGGQPCSQQVKQCDQVRALGPLNLTREIPQFDLPPVPGDEEAASAVPEEVTL